MRVLQICNKSPWPPKEGGSMAMYAVTKSLINEKHQVKVIAMNTNKYKIDIQDIPAGLKNNTGIELAYVDLSIRPFHALMSLLSFQNYIVKRFDNNNFRNLLRKTLENQKFDIVQLETLYLTPFIKDIRELSQAKIVLRAHNIEHKIWKRYAANTTNPIKKIYIKILSQQLESYEKKHIHDYDGILPITDIDKDFFQSYVTKPLIQTHTFAIEPVETKAATQRETNTLFHLGSMDWLPNQEGINWFLEHVWPDVQVKNPKLSFALAGRNIPEVFLKMNIPGLKIDGEVEDAGEYMQSKQIMIVPLFSGSGIRIKIIEGMLHKNLVITTPIGAEGIDCVNRKHLLIAHSATEFKDAIIWSLENPDETARITQNAATLIRKKYNLAESSKDLTSFYHKLANM